MPTERVSQEQPLRSKLVGVVDEVGQRSLVVGRRDLAALYPEHARTWNYERNRESDERTLRTYRCPENLVATSQIVVWWQAGCGHEWEMAVATWVRHTRTDVCPRCVRSLAAKYPETARLWHPRKNGGSTPMEVAPGSRDLAWWLGDCGHEYRQYVWRAVGGHGCTLCEGSKGENAVADWLDERGIEYEREWSPPGLGRLRFDFVVHGRRVLVEFDGDQHRRPVRWTARWTPTQAQEAFERQVERDARKDVWATRNRWTLVRIGDLGSVPDRLSEALSL